MLYITTQKKDWECHKVETLFKCLLLYAKRPGPQTREEEEYAKVKGGKNQNETWFAENREAEIG